MKYDKAELSALFAKPFDDDQWADVLAELFGARQDPKRKLLKPTPFTLPFPDAKGWYLGSFTTADGYLVGLFRFETDSVRRRRVGLRNLLKPLLKWSHDAALAVFTERGSSAWRFSFVCDLKGEATAAKRFTYVFGDPSCRTPVERFLALRDSREEGKPVSFSAMTDAFSVEALSDEFFRAYKEHYETFVSHVTGKRFVKGGGKWVETEVSTPHPVLYDTFGRDDKLVRDYVKKLLGRLVFLHFLQKKGWMGAKNGIWTGGDPAFLRNLFERSSPAQKADFLDAVLEKLFFEALNTDRTADGDRFDAEVDGFRQVRIPYLNGGLFERDGLDALRVKFPADFFANLLRFFSEYNFTIDENDADEAEVGIDPEMLGRIFENLLEDNKDKGAFYTPKEIVRYMCRRSLLAHLSDGKAARSFPFTEEDKDILQDGGLLTVKPVIYAANLAPFPWGSSANCSPSAPRSNPTPTTSSAKSSKTTSTAWTSKKAPWTSPDSASGSPSSSMQTNRPRSPTSTSRSCRATPLSNRGADTTSPGLPTPPGRKPCRRSSFPECPCRPGNSRSSIPSWTSTASASVTSCTNGSLVPTTANAPGCARKFTPPSRTSSTSKDPTFPSTTSTPPPTPSSSFGTSGSLMYSTTAVLTSSSGTHRMSLSVKTNIRNNMQLDSASKVVKLTCIVCSSKKRFVVWLNRAVSLHTSHPIHFSPFLAVPYCAK